MASVTRKCGYLVFLLPLCVLFMGTSAYPTQISRIYPFACSNSIKTCNSYLYQHNGFKKEQIASYYSANTSQIRPITDNNRNDNLVAVPCSCKNVNGTDGYFYDTDYTLQRNDTFANVSNQIYSGQAWKVGGEENYTAGLNATMHLLCGCVESDSQIVVTYTVQPLDTLSSIADLLASDVAGIQSLNTYLAANPSYLDIGWLLYVPMEKSGVSPIKKGHQPLSWTARTQIALDAARGIEYIHDHTKARYVHRDIKTSNILLDETLRAKVADFGLVKLVGRTNEDELMATRLVGTPGYLPPESVKELQVTTKTDVFAFGVVLAELITGKRALFRDNMEPQKMKSLITILNSAFEDEDPESALESMVDGNLRGSYPMEDVYKMAEISQWCLSGDAINRPEMREVVVALSQIRVSSVEWEASLGGNSQVFSGVFNGR